MADSKCGNGSEEINNNATTKMNVYYKKTDENYLQPNIPKYMIYRQKQRSKIYPYTIILLAQ